MLRGPRAKAMKTSEAVTVDDVSEPSANTERSPSHSSVPSASAPQAVVTEVEVHESSATPVSSSTTSAPSASTFAPSSPSSPETTLVSSSSGLASSPRSSARTSSRRPPPDSSSPSSLRLREAALARAETRKWVAVWIAAGFVSVGVGVYLALRG